MLNNNILQSKHAIYKNKNIQDVQCRRHQIIVYKKIMYFLVGCGIWMSFKQHSNTLKSNIEINKNIIIKFIFVLFLLSDVPVLRRRRRLQYRTVRPP